MCSNLLNLYEKYKSLLLESESLNDSNKSYNYCNDINNDHVELCRDFILRNSLSHINILLKNNGKKELSKEELKSSLNYIECFVKERRINLKFKFNNEFLKKYYIIVRLDRSFKPRKMFLI